MSSSRVRRTASALVILSTQSEPAYPATTYDAFQMLNRAAAGGLHEGEIEAADFRMRFGQSVKNAVVCFDLRFTATADGMRLVTEHVELLSQIHCGCIGIRRRNAFRGSRAELGAHVDQQVLHAGFAECRVEPSEQTARDHPVIARKQIAP